MELSRHDMGQEKRNTNIEATHLEEEPSSARPNAKTHPIFYYNSHANIFFFLAVSALTRPVSSASTDCWFAVRSVFCPVPSLD